MGAYATQDAIEEARLENADWQDEQSAYIAEQAHELMEMLGSTLTDKWTDSEYDEAQDRASEFIKSLMKEARMM
ncbi:hypothetical protein [Providencia stuartii]|uniref:hypothetical protein n=1 Tax=Providencia stuartii TaxID=588 RepID=UPI001B6BB4EA|nr:hypothetical protein [Providencia stuartii]MBQ0693629.1 hypothetical protein [Providencia stuartii]